MHDERISRLKGNGVTRSGIRRGEVFTKMLSRNCIPSGVKEKYVSLANDVYCVLIAPNKIAAIAHQRCHRSLFKPNSPQSREIKQKNTALMYGGIAPGKPTISDI